jgi:hypothetical protein
MEIQESKKDLAGVLFSPHEDNQAGNVGRLEVCSSQDAERAIFEIFGSR